MIGLKQAVGALDADTLAVLRDAPESFSALAGDDAFTGPTILMGGRGAIAAAAHVCTPLFVSLVSAAVRGDVGTTREFAERLLPVVLAGFAEPNPAAWKGALHHLGEISTAALRRPMASAGDGAIAALIDAARVAAALEGVRGLRCSQGHGNPELAERPGSLGRLSCPVASDRCPAEGTHTWNCRTKQPARSGLT